MNIITMPIFPNTKHDELTDEDRDYLALNAIDTERERQQAIAHWNSEHGKTVAPAPVMTMPPMLSF